MRDEYEFDYTKAKPNRYAMKPEAGSIEDKALQIATAVTVQFQTWQKLHSTPTMDVMRPLLTHAVYEKAVSVLSAEPCKPNSLDNSGGL
jgi:hypothetical protein